MNLSWNATQVANARRFEHLGRDLVRPRSEVHHLDVRLDLEAWEAMAEEGLWRLAVPAELGGDGGTWWDFASALEGITRGGRDLGFSLSLIAHAGLVRALVLFGTPAAQRALLPKLMGGAVGATALTEATGGSDVARIRTVGRRAGRAYELTGVKEHITNAPVADVFFVLGRLAGEPAKADLTVFLVESSMSGVRVGEPETMFGNGSSPTGELRLEGARLPSWGVLGRPGDGLDLTYRTVALDRLLYGVVGAAYLDTLLVEALGYARSRRAFGAPIADHQYVQRRITNIKIAAESARWLSYAALHQVVSDGPDVALMSSAAKLVGSEGLAAGAVDAMQVFGHLGYEAGFVSRSVADALGTLIAGGTSDIQRKNIFTQLTAAAAARDAQRWDYQREAA